MALSNDPPGEAYKEIFAFEKPHLDRLSVYSGMTGRILAFFGWAIKIKDADSKGTYIKINDIVSELVGKGTHLEKEKRKMINQRILEITAPDSRTGLSKEKLQQLFKRFFDDQSKSIESLTTSTEIIDELEKIKLDLSDIKSIYYKDSLSEIVEFLQPGDILIRKYHEINDNIICNAQQFFYKDGYREAFKCSHLALYLGEINGNAWIAEASLPRGIEPHLRRVKIDDPRFNSKTKNQYLIVRRVNQEIAQESARLAKNYVTKLLPESEHLLTEESELALKYSKIAAIRSLWSSSHLRFTSKQRLFKYYSDYKNAIAFEFLGQRQPFFCSHFAMVMGSMAEMNKSRDFQAFIKKHPIPAKYDDRKTGISLKLSRLWYSIRKGMWARWLVLTHNREIDHLITLKLDALRISPQTAVNYMLDHQDQYHAIGMVTRLSDFKPNLRP